MLVISPNNFNTRTGAAVILPITNGGAFAVRLGLAISLPHSMTTTGIVRCDQPRTIDLKERGARYVETAPLELLYIVLERFISVFDPEAEDL